MTMPSEYHDKKEEYLDNRSPEQVEREEEEAENEKFMAEVDKAYSILWEMLSPGSNMYKEDECPWGKEKELKLKKMIGTIDEVLGR